MYQLGKTVLATRLYALKFRERSVLTIRREPKMLPTSWANMYAKPAETGKVIYSAAASAKPD